MAQETSFCFHPNHTTHIQILKLEVDSWYRLCISSPNWKWNLFGLFYITAFHLSSRPSSDLTLSPSWTLKCFSYSHITGCFLLLIQILKRPLFQHLKGQSTLTFKYFYLVSMEASIIGLLFPGTQIHILTSFLESHSN